MSFFLFTSKKAAALGLDKKTAALFQILPAASLAGHKPGSGDMSYLDISGLAGAELKKALARFKKRCGSAPWGIFDPKGGAEDPAAFFFDGASDYIKGSTLKAGIGRKRMEQVFCWRSGPEERGKKTSGAPALPRQSVKLPPGKFEGWKNIRHGLVAPFFFLYASFSGKTNLRSRVGETMYRTIHDRMREYLQQCLQEANALLWMETEADFLFLVPPKAACGRAALIAGLKTIMARPLVGTEILGLSVPLSFTFALHYGKTPFHAPGKTGTVVSDAVNFIFHLGAKHAEPDRLSISGEVSGEIIPPGLEDLFIDAGEYEGFTIRHSRRFSYSK